MDYKPLGNTGLQVSAVIMGTWQAGKKMWAGIDDRQSTEAIRAAFEAGITTFDTAEQYGDGHSERTLGQALSDRRDQVLLATKVFPNHLKYDQVIEACHRSLNNLGTDYIDLYQIHWPSGSFGAEIVPIEETMAALVDLQREGKIRALGVSNFNRSQVEAALAHGPIVSVQPPYSLFWRQAEKELLPYCWEKGLTVLAYSPMAQGILADRFGPQPTFAKGDHRRKNRLFQPDNYQRVQEALPRLRAVAKRLGLTTGQLALAWVIAHARTCAIAGARSADQARQNAMAGDIRLREEDMKELDAIGRLVTDHLDDNPMIWNF